jgi:hypothetical protein
MKHLLVAALLIFVAGCQRGPMFGGSSCGSYGNADRKTTTVVVTQRDPQRHLLFVIAWTAKRGGGTTSCSDHNLLTSIDGHSVNPSLDKPAVYALRSDYSLKQIPLTKQQIVRLFSEIEDADFHTSHSELWQKEIAPHLAQVELDDAR